MNRISRNSQRNGRSKLDRTNLIDVVRSNLRFAGLTSSSLLVAVSGGPDSLTVLHLLNRLRTECELSLHVVHVDHGLRPGSSKDRSVVRKVSRSMGIQFTGDTIDIDMIHSEDHRSPEDTARVGRYNSLARIAAKMEMDAIVLGHTADDQAETILLNLIRGTGITGLLGMKVLSTHSQWGNSKITLFRPLLGINRQMIERYCSFHALTPLVDPSNRDIKIPRNRVRSKILTQMKLINPGAVNTISRLGSNLTTDMDYIGSMVEKLWEDLIEVASGKIEIDRVGFLVADPGLKRHLLRKVFRTLQGNLKGFERVHIEQIIQATKSSPTGILDLPAGMTVEFTKLRITFMKRVSEAYSEGFLEQEHLIWVPGNETIGPWNVSTKIIPTPMQLDRGEYTALINPSVIGTRLIIRSWRAGDKFQPLGMNGKGKKLQDFFVDRYVPRSRRSEVPLVLSDRGVVWVVGHRIANWAKVERSTTTSILMEFSSRSGLSD